MIILIKNIDVYSPASLGKKDVLILSDKIALISDSIQEPEFMQVKVIDGSDKVLMPGFIDSHVHITGGGGEGGFTTRTPEIMLTDITLGGVTTVIGTLGTDGITRTMSDLLAKARALEEEGITSYIYTGSYQIPVRTLTGSILEDMILIDKIIGVGEIAISDHRSSQPTFDEIAKIAAEARVGGLLSGKAGVVNLHMGDSKRMLDIIEEILDKTEIPMKHFVPTHMNRNPYLFEKSREYAKKGGYVDFTTSTTPQFLEEGETKCSKALRILLDDGADESLITFTSDGQGSLPAFDEKGRTTGLDVGRVTSLFEEVRDAVLTENIPLEKAIKVITSNPADILKLNNKGYIAEGKDADLVIADKTTLEIHSVIAKGRVMVEDKRAMVKGTFEK